MSARKGIQSRTRARPRIHGMCGAALLLAATAVAAENRVFVAFETAALDLDSGVVTDRPPSELAGPGWSGEDIYFAYNAGRITRAVLTPLAGAEVVILYGSRFTDIMNDDVDGLPFSARPEDVAFGTLNTALVRTAEGGVYKLGNPRETDAGVSFDYELLRVGDGE